MFDWLKKKGAKAPVTPANTPCSAPSVREEAAEPTSRETLINEANRNARAAREAIGQENLDRLARMIHQKQEVSPAAQARKIIAKMDTEKLSEHLRYLRNEPPTKH